MPKTFLIQFVNGTSLNFVAEEMRSTYYDYGEQIRLPFYQFGYQPDPVKVVMKWTDTRWFGLIKEEKEEVRQRFREFVVEWEINPKEIRWISVLPYEEEGE